MFCKNSKKAISGLLYLKFFLFSEIAVPDESNPWRRSSDMTFHSKEKQFLCLHPTSVYSSRPELLTQEASETKKKIEGRPENTKELLAFVSLLETNKPYIMNSMRVPVLQTILLFSSSLDTNSDCTRVICDGWIEIGFQNGDSAQQLLSDVIKLRTAWDKLLELRLSTVESNRDNGPHSEHISYLQRSLSRKLAEFIDSKIQYSYRRISSTETSYLYVTSIPEGDETEASDSDDTPQDTASQWLPLEGGEPHPTKGGLRVTEYMTYGCIRDDLSVAVAKRQAEYLREHYHCPLCEEHLICNILERLQHDRTCHLNQPVNTQPNLGVVAEEESGHEKGAGHSAVGEREGLTTGELRQAKNSSDGGEQSERLPLKTEYYCSICEQTLDCTPVEILKHKRSHK